jgi:hypothetical protein
MCYWKQNVEQGVEIKGRPRGHEMSRRIAHAKEK